MNQKTGILLLVYGLFLIVLGFAGALFNPATGVVGFNAAAVSGVIAGGVGGVLSIIWGLCLMNGFCWARIAAIVTTALFAVAFGWRGVTAWMGVADGVAAKWYAATVISAMTILSLAMLVRLLARHRTGSM